MAPLTRGFRPLGPRTQTPGAAGGGPAREQQHLAEFVRLLYPEPHVIEIPGTPAAARTADSPPVVAEYLLLPHARRPRLALPANPRGTRLAALRHTPAPRGGLDRLRLAAVRAALGTSCAPFRARVRVLGPPCEDSLEAYLHQALGERVALCLYIGGPLRANRKPVMAVLDGTGRPIGIAKLGVNPLTRALVRAEADALALLGGAGLRAATVPALHHAGRWREHDILVQGVLPVWQRPAVRAGAAISRAMLEVAGAAGTRICALGDSPYRGELSRRLDAIAHRQGTRDVRVGRALRTAGLDVLGRRADVELTFGSWHGDWTPWNTHPLRDSVLVWDWERFAQGVPVGYDALHHALSRSVERGIVPAEAARHLIREAATLVAPYGVPAAAAELTAVLYLVDVGARYLADRLDETGQRLSAIGEWLLPMVVQARAGC